jgi:hypothetical protein
MQLNEKLNGIHAFSAALPCLLDVIDQYEAIGIQRHAASST